MLELKNIKKTYRVGNIETKALNGISVAFREKEFVAILGTSGSGKTTCLNIIGGLDRYDSGDLIIKGKSTKDFKDTDWDAYRNNSVGFVFQSYNLIPHLSIVENVEMSMTLSGVPAAQKHKRAIEVLERVGLSDHLHKKPSQLSGGQTQRVAIARALVNDPEILLCDEPTGALDTATSVQIMDLIKELSGDRLVIMVTHNPALAEQYADRIVRFEDGKIIDDSHPHTERPKDGSFSLIKTGMSFFTAMKLSFRNLMTKKGRTFMVSFAGSIGIIGIALILSLSNGVDAYIASVEEDTLSNYPLTLEETTVDMSSLLTSFSDNGKSDEEHEDGKIYSNNVTGEMLNAMVDGVTSNNLESFKAYIEGDGADIYNYASAISYGYSTEMNIYRADTENGLVKVNPSPMLELMYGDMAGSMTAFSSMSGGSVDVWSQLIDNEELLEKQYDVICGRMPEAYNEVVLTVNEFNEISDFTLYTLGIKDQSEVSESMETLMSGGSLDISSSSYTYDEIMQNTFKLLLNTDYYEYDEATGTWIDRSDDEDYIKNKLDSDGVELKIVGILRPSEDSVKTSSSGSIGYTAALTEYLIDRINNSDIVKAQMSDPDTDIFTGISFSTDGTEDSAVTIEDISAYIATLPEDEQSQYNTAIGQMYAAGADDAAVAEQFAPLVQKASTDATYDGNLLALGVADADKPSAIEIYPKDFESKEYIKNIIDEYNDSVQEDDKIQYTDYVGIMMSSITTIINAISYILIAFVSISLVVSSIMIGIITYISVLERTKEIGILRAIGASKKDISRVFNAETIIIGLVAGAIGIGATLLIDIPINMIIKSLAGISGVAALPAGGAVILIAISVFLTFIAGLFPSSIAAKKDPVIALRSE